MFGSQVLDTGIGLAMLFAFMSLIATSINEAIETFFKARAKQLEQGIRNILDDPTGQGLTGEFFKQPLINVLFSGNYDPAKLRLNSLRPGDIIEKKQGANGQGSAPPALIDSKPTLTKAAMDAVNKSGAKALAVPIQARGALPSYIPAASFAKAVLAMAGKDGVQTVQDIRNALDETTGISPLRNTQLGRLIRQSIDIADQDFITAQKRLEEWYDASMDRVSGWYKRRTQYILFFIGIFAAVVMNVDTIQVTRSLMSDPALRDAIVAQASNIDKTDAATLTAVQEDLAKMGLPIGWAKLPQLQGAPGSTPTCNEFGDCFSLLGKKLSEGALSIPLSMIFGWLITAFAIALGAPFWFDILNKLMQLRATTKPATPPPVEKNPEEKTSAAAQPSVPSNTPPPNAPDIATIMKEAKDGEAQFTGETWTSDVQTEKNKKPVGQEELL